MPFKLFLAMIKSFKDWTTFDLEQTFGLQKQAPEECTVLNDWLNVPNVVTDERINFELEDIRADLTEYADIWNEAELKYAASQILSFFSYPTFPMLLPNNLQ